MIKILLIALLVGAFFYNNNLFIHYCYRLGQPIDGSQGIECVTKVVAQDSQGF